jgi:hypothetical protein
LTPKEFYTIERPHTYLIFVYKVRHTSKVLPQVFAYKGTPVVTPQPVMHVKIVAKTCGREKNRQTVTYQFIDSYLSLCLDKKDLILGQEACERLLECVLAKED